MEIRELHMTFRAVCLAGSAVLAFAAAAPVAAQGTVEVAIVGDPDTFDPMMSTKDVVSIVTQHFMETLYTFDDNWAVVPLLAADMPTISEDGLTYTIPLRKGVSFQDGSAMDSADVLASLQRTARAKGMTERRVVLRHALKNAGIPIITVIDLTFALLVSGAVVTERVFNLPGMGNLVVNAVLRRDYPVIQGTLIVVAGLYVLVNLLTDLLYLVVDKRVKY